MKRPSTAQVFSPATTRIVTRPQAQYDPKPVGFDTLGLEPSLLEGIRIRGFAVPEDPEEPEKGLYDQARLEMLKGPPAGCHILTERECEPDPPQ